MSPKMTNLEYAITGLEYGRLVEQLISITKVIVSLQTKLDTRAYILPLPECFFGYDPRVIIEYETLYFNILMDRAESMFAELLRERMLRHPRDSQHLTTLTNPLIDSESFNIIRQKIQQPWSVGEGSRFDNYAPEHLPGKAFHRLQSYAVIELIQKLECKLDHLGRKSPEILKNVVTHGRDLSWLLMTGRGNKSLGKHFQRQQTRESIVKRSAHP
jgi:hypothetical protein